MYYSSRLLPIMMIVVAACASASSASTGASAPAEGIVRVTNYARESVSLFLATTSGDTFLRLIYPGHSESFGVPGASPGDVVHLKAKTAKGLEYVPREGITITLGNGACARQYDVLPKSGCEWILP